MFAQLKPPPYECVLSFGLDQYRSRAEVEQSSQISAAAFADTAENRFATGRVLARYQTDPRREMQTRTEFSCFADGSDDRRRRERVYPWNGGQARTFGTVCVPGQKFGFAAADVRVVAADLFSQELEGGLSIVREFALAPTSRAGKWS